jgi:mevalonate kinase
LVTDLAELKNDVETGMYFDSSIPQGYGVGSSGALVAAIYMPKTKLLF